MTDTTPTAPERPYSPLTIHIEGLDLAGKSTTCRMLRDHLKAEMRHCSLLPDNPIYYFASDLHVAQKVKTETAGGIFLGSVMRDLERYTPPDHYVVQDSTSVLRSIAYHSVIGDPGLADAFRSLLPRYPRFGASFVLWSSHEVRLMRLEGRISRHHDTPEDYFIRDFPDKFNKMQDIIIETAKEWFGAEVVDTSNMEREGEKERLVASLASKLPAAGK
ncbi:MAG: hypothetical protein IJK04_09555 [Kiritimatiellae bacterium]|nr:hypothetical protein [Kiritimatiellia bacterium]